MSGHGRAHPVSIAFNLGRVLYLLLIPLLRGFVSALRGGFPQWLRGAWMDILVFLAMLGIAVLVWRNTLFRYDGERLEIRSGLLNRRHLFIPWERVAAVTITEPFFLRPFKAVRFRADTVGGGPVDADLSILLWDKQAKAIMDSRKSLKDRTLGKIHQPSTGSIVALSLLTSNSFGGILFIAAFISQAGRLLGRGFSQMIIGTFEEAARSLAFGVPPAAAAIAYILLAGWLIGFLLSFVRYKNLTLLRKRDTLSINGGIFTKREYFIQYSDVNFIDIRQSVSTRVLRLYSLYLSAVGYGKQKDDISCVIPTESGARFRKSLERVFPALVPSPRRFSPKPTGVLKFVGLPVSCLFAVAAAIAVSLRFFPLWSGFIWFVGLMACAPALVFLIVRALDFRSSGISFEDGNYTLRYSRGLSLHTVVISAERVVCVELRQSPFQKRGRYCDVILSSRAEGRSVHCCQGLVMDDMIKLFELNDERSDS